MKRKILSLLVLVTLLLSAGLFGTSTVYAQATAYEVNFMLDRDDEKSVYQTFEVEENRYLTIPETPSKNGSVFLYWETASGDKFSFSKTRITEDLNLYAKWESIAEFFTVTFVVDGNVVSVQEVEKGASAIEPSSVVCPAGKTFLRWDKSTEAVTENITVNAVLADVYYTVSVYADNELISAGRVKHGESATFIESLTIPEKEHYIADGFIGETENIVKDGKVYVNYLPVSYQIDYLVENETYFSTEVAYGKVATMPTAFPEKNGYIFVGWFVGDTVYDFNTLVSGDLILTARFIAIEKPKYTVTFYDYNGNQYGGVQVIEEGQSAILPGHPIREGYEFIGWSEEFSAVTKDLNIYPMYSVKTYSVIVKDYTGVIATFEVNYGQSITVDTALVNEKEGYEFIGFDESLKNITKDTVINAKYRAKTFVVRFYTDNLQLIGTQNVEYGKSAKAPKVEKEGFIFIGWLNMDTKELDDYTLVTEHSNYVAAYQTITYIVTFMENGIPVFVTEVAHGKNAPMHSYVKDGFVFNGWYLDAGLTNAYDFNNQVKGDLTLYAKWTATVNPTFTATFLVDGQVYNLQSVERYAKVTTPPKPIKEGYTFRRWDVVEKGYSWLAHEDIREYLTEDLTFVAVFDKITYSVKFVWGGNNNGIKYGETVWVEHGQEAVLSSRDLNEEGYIFVRWDKDTTSVTSDMTVNAIYKKEVYTVTFTDEEGNVLSTQQVEYKDCAQIVSTPKKEGHTFASWYNVTDYRTFTFDYAIKHDTIIKATFNINSYKLIYYIDGTMYRTVDMTYNQVINPLNPPSYNREEKIFLGWSEIPERMPANNVNVYGETYVYQFYDLTLYIDGEFYKNYSVREDKNTPNLPTPKDLPETIIFKSWGEVPSIMPKHNVRVDAVIEKLAYYKLFYYVEGSIFTVETVLQGKHIYNPSKYKDEVSDMFDETKVFLRWKYDGNDYMPASDLIIHAEIEYKNYYKLSYYVNDVLYKSFNLLNGTTIENTEYELGAPTGLPENVEFRGWTRIPDWMPKEDVRIDAYIHLLEYHKLKYIVDGNVYAEFDVLEGNPLPRVEDPEFDGTKWFVSWNNDTEEMPGRDLSLYASLIYLNDIKTESWDEIDDTPQYYYSIKISGVVNFVAIKLNVESRYATEVILDEQYASYSFETHTLVYASGEVITEETTIATFVGDTRLNHNMFSKIEIYTINDAGEIVKTVCYMNGTKN